MLALTSGPCMLLGSRSAVHQVHGPPSAGTYSMCLKEMKVACRQTWAQMEFDITCHFPSASWAGHLECNLDMHSQQPLCAGPEPGHGVRKMDGALSVHSRGSL